MTNVSRRNNHIYNERNTAWTLIYKGSRNGFEPQDFHRACDGQRKTLTIIQSIEGYLFGGYVKAAWKSCDPVDNSNSNDQYIRDSQAFIFTLSNPYHIPPTRYALKLDQESHAIVGNSKYGPCFGASDIYVNSGKQCGFGFSSTYMDTTGRGNQTFTGAETCSVQEIEVYQAK